MSHLVVVFTNSCSCFQAAVLVIGLWDPIGYCDTTFLSLLWELQVRLGFQIMRNYRTQLSTPHRLCYLFSHQTATRPATSLGVTLDSFCKIEVPRASITSFVRPPSPFLAAVASKMAYPPACANAVVQSVDEFHHLTAAIVCSVWVCSIVQGRTQCPHAQLNSTVGVPLLGHIQHLRILSRSLEHGQPSGPRIASSPSRHLPPCCCRFSPSFLPLWTTTRFFSPSAP